MEQHDLGKRLAKVRRLGGLTRSGLSIAAELPQAIVGQIERGETRTPRTSTIAQLAEVLGVSLDWLVLGEGPEPTAADVLAAVERARARRSA